MRARVFNLCECRHAILGTRSLAKDSKTRTIDGSSKEVQMRIDQPRAYKTTAHIDYASTRQIRLQPFRWPHVYNAVALNNNAARAWTII